MDEKFARVYVITAKEQLIGSEIAHLGELTVKKQLMVEWSARVGDLTAKKQLNSREVPHTHQKKPSKQPHCLLGFLIYVLLPALRSGSPPCAAFDSAPPPEQGRWRLHQR